LKNEKDIEHGPILESDSEAAISSYSNSGHEEDSAAAEYDNNASGSKVHIWSRLHHPLNSGNAHPFTGSPSGLRIQEAFYVNKDSTSTTIFLFFMR